MSRMYSVVEVFPTIQGEGTWAGRRAVFVRFTGCNLWSGRPEDRDKGAGACARWCDTKFTGGDRYPERDLINRMGDAWGAYAETFRGRGVVRPMVVFTGGEPTLQLTPELVRALQADWWYVAVETNGTRDVEALDLCDHVCVSPKRGSTLRRTTAHELKVVLPGAAPGEEGWSDADLLSIRNGWSWGALWVQPQDEVDPRTVEVTALTMGHGAVRSAWHAVARTRFAENVAHARAFVDRHPEWRLGVQAHKFLGLR